MKCYCPPESQAVVIGGFWIHMTAAPAAGNPTLKKGCEETNQSFFTALSIY